MLGSNLFWSAARASAANGGASTDPYAASVATLHHFEGTPGSSGIVADKGPDWQVVAGTPTISTVQKKAGNSSLYLDPVSSTLVQTGVDVASSEAFCVEFWMLAAADPMGNRSFLTMGSPGAYLHIVHRFDSGVGYLMLQGSPVSPDNYLTPGTWQHIAVVRNGNLLRVYINGTSTGLIWNTNVWTNFLVRWGYNGSVYGNGLNQFVDGVRITIGHARYTGPFTPEYPEG